MESQNNNIFIFQGNNMISIKTPMTIYLLGSLRVMRDYLNDPRFEGIKPFENRVWLSSPTMHGEEMLFLKDAFETLVK